MAVYLAVAVSSQRDRPEAIAGGGDATRALDARQLSWLPFNDIFIIRSNSDSKLMRYFREQCELEQ